MEEQRPTDAAATSEERSTTLTQRLLQLMQIVRERVGSDCAPATPAPVQPQQERFGNALEQINREGALRAEGTRNDQHACGKAACAVAESETPAKRHRGGHSNKALVGTAIDALETITLRRRTNDHATSQLVYALQPVHKSLRGISFTRVR